MVAEARIVKITPEITANDLLDGADDAPVIVERDGVRYRVVRETSVPSTGDDYDPERALEALQQTIGIFDDVDTDAWIADIYESRIRGSRPESDR